MQLIFRVAVEFLLGNRFSLDVMCKHGVPYLSRDEETKAIERAVEDCAPRAPIEAVEVKDTDLESVQFLSNVRYLIDNWLAQGIVSRCLPRLKFKLTAVARAKAVSSTSRQLPAAKSCQQTELCRGR